MVRIRWCALLLIVAAVSARTLVAQIPGLPYPVASESVSDQKSGSILLYNLFASDFHAAHIEDTRINITNTTSLGPVFAHLYWVNGQTCSSVDTFVSLAKNQSVTLLASQKMPGVRGFLIAQAVDALGRPIEFNLLVGDALIQLSGGQKAKINAEAIATAPEPNCPVNVAFDNSCFGRVPRALALSSLTGPIDLNASLLVVNRFGGDLSVPGGAGAIGPVAGTVYDSSGTPLNFTIPSAGCQFISTLSNMVPLTTPNIGSAIPGGKNGWLTLWSTGTTNQTPTGGASDPIAIFGASLNFDAAHGHTGNTHHLTQVTPSFLGGSNLHIQTFNPLTILKLPATTPVF